MFIKRKTRTGKAYAYLMLLSFKTLQRALDNLGDSSETKPHNILRSRDTIHP